MRIKKGQLRRIIQEYGQPYVEPPGNVIGVVGADIDGDYRYYQELTVTHDPSTDEVTIVVKDAGAVGGMDYQGPGEGRSEFMQSGKTVLPAGAKGKDVVATIKDMIYQYADTIKRYGKPSKNFTWADSTYSRGPKGLNAKLATAALKKARAGGSVGSWMPENKVIRESTQFAATAAEEAAKVNRDLGETSGAPGSYSEDQAYWEKYGIVTGEDLAIDLVAGTYSDMYKALHNRRPRTRFNSYEEVRIALEDLERYYADKAERDELEAKAQAEYERERDELAAMMPTALELQYDKMPPRSGMGRRHEGMEKHMLRTTRKRLRQIIEQVSQEINEMPVSTGGGYFSKDFDKRYPHLVKLADQIDALASQYGFDDANIEKFDSGIVGISIDLWGDKTELVVVDQPGKTGLEDHSLAFISYGKYPEAAHGKTADGIYFKPDDRGRKFGDTSIRQPDRERVYAQILADLEKKFSAAETGTGRIYGEADTKKYDDDSALKGKQSELPDELQKGIIDKTVEDREEDEEEKKKNEGFHILNRLIGEELTQAVTDDEFVEGLRRTWDAVRVDVGIRNPSWEDKADEAMAMFGTYEPDLANKFGALPFKDQDMLLRLAFDDQNFFGKMY